MTAPSPRAAARRSGSPASRSAAGSGSSPAPAATSFHLVWPHTHATAVIEAWQAWAPAAPDELAASLLLAAGGDVGQPPLVNLFGAMLGTEAIVALVEHLPKGRVPGQSRELDFTPWGGAYNRVHDDATAFAHRGELFLLKHAVVVDPDASTAEREAARRWLAQVPGR